MTRSFVLLLALFAVGACRSSPSAQNSLVPVDRPLREVSSPSDGQTAMLDGPLYRTILARGCAIVNPRAIACATRRHAPRPEVRWQTLGEEFSPDERFVHIDADSQRICALVRPSGRILCWAPGGPALDGRSGFFSRPTPQPAAGAIDFALLDRAMCTLESQGAVFCWGDNASGQLGDGTRKPHGEPREVALPAAVVDIEGGYNAVCALLETEAVYCWGDSDVPNDPRRLKPERIRGLLGVTALEEFGLARLADGRWAQWDRLNHVPDHGFTGVELVAAADTWRRSRGCWVEGASLWCKPSRGDPAAAVLERVVELDEEGRSTCARRTDGSIWCFGSDAPLFDPPPEVPEEVPTQVPGLANVKQVVAAVHGACALHDDGAVSCWGEGNHVPRDRTQLEGFIGTPTRIPLTGPADEIIVARGSSCARVYGSAQCWTKHGRSQDLGPASALGTRVGLSCAVTADGLRCLDDSPHTGEHPRLVPAPPAARTLHGGRRCSTHRGRVDCDLYREHLGCPRDDASASACRLSEDPAPAPLTLETRLRAGRRDRVLVGFGGVCVLRESGGFRCGNFTESWPRFDGFAREVKGIVRAAVSLQSACTIDSQQALRCWFVESDSAKPGRFLALGINDAVELSLSQSGGYTIREDGTLWAWGPNEHGERGLGGESWSHSDVPMEAALIGPDTKMPVRED